MRLPLAQRELARLGRSRRVYVWRALLIASIPLVLAVIWADISVPGRGGGPEMIGIMIYALCAMAQAAIVFVIIPALAAPAIATERNQHMLPLLLIADFGGWDILAAKALAVLLEAGLLLLALAPIQFMSTVFGGVTPAVIAAQTVILAALVVYSTMLSMLCSCIVRTTAGAVFAAVGLVIGSLIALYILDLAVFRQLFQFQNVPRIFYELGSKPAPSKRSAAVIMGLAMLAGWAVIRLLPRIAADPPRRYLVGAPTPYGHTSRRLLRWGPVLPMLSVYATGLTSTLRSGSVRIAVALLLAAIGSVPILGTLIVVMLFAQEITSSFGSVQRSGALDDLRMTLLEPRTIAADIIRFYWWRGLLYVPALILCAVQLGLFADSAYFGPGTPKVDIIGGHVAIASVYAFSWAAGAVGLGFAQAFAIVALCCVSAMSGRDARRQLAVALAILGAAYALCVLGIQCQDHLMYHLKIRDVWFRVPLVLAVSIGLFLALGLVCRAEVLRLVECGPARRPTTTSFFRRQAIRDA